MPTSSSYFLNNLLLFPTTYCLSYHHWLCSSFWPVFALQAYLFSFLLPWVLAVLYAQDLSFIIDLYDCSFNYLEVHIVATNFFFFSVVDVYAKHLKKCAWILSISSQLCEHKNLSGMRVFTKHRVELLPLKITCALVISAAGCDLMRLERFMMSEQVCISCCSIYMLNKFMACSHDFWLAPCILFYIKCEMFDCLSVSSYITG